MSPLGNYGYPKWPEKHHDGVWKMVYPLESWGKRLSPMFGHLQRIRGSNHPLDESFYHHPY